MPIVNPTDVTAVVEKPTTVKIAAPQYRGVVVDTRYLPSSALLTNIEGSSWSVNYFSQVLNADNALSGQQMNLNAIYQQYRMIEKFELKVTTPLSSSQDTDTSQMNVTGAANVYPFLIPNVGDMFLADIGDGREGVFRITLSERRSIFKDTCYGIEYQLVDYSTEERRADFASKTIQKFLFMKDFLQYGQNPLLLAEDATNIRTLQGRYYELTRDYFRNFTSNEYKTLLIPSQPSTIYDHFVTKVMTTIVSTTDAREVSSIRRLNVDGDDAMKATNLWDCLLERDKRLLDLAARESGTILTKMFSRNARHEGIYYSGISYVVYFKDPELTVDYGLYKQSQPLSATRLIPVPSRSPVASALFEPTVLNGVAGAGAPLLHPVLIDNHYVLSEAFYTRSEAGQSKLELAVHDYLDGEAPNFKSLVEFCDSYHAWGPLERYYYTPILLILMKSAIRSL
jgi:hypothetical protein